MLLSSELCSKAYTSLVNAVVRVGVHFESLQVKLTRAFFFSYPTCRSILRMRRTDSGKP